MAILALPCCCCFAFFPPLSANYGLFAYSDLGKMHPLQQLPTNERTD